LWGQIKGDVLSGKPYSKSFRGKAALEFPDSVYDPHREEDALVVKVGDIHDVTRSLATGAKRVILSATRHNLERMVSRRLTPAQRDRFAWSLPALITDKDAEYYRPAVKWFLEKGFRTWEVNNWGHFDFFKHDSTVNLIAGARFNIRNRATSAALALEGCRWSVFSLEITGHELQDFARGPYSSIPIVTVYYWPPLFTSRLNPNIQEDKPFTTPRKDVYLMRKKGAFTFIYADRPVNWLGKLDLLRAYGYRYFLLDLSEGPLEQGSNLESVLEQFRRSRPDGPHDLFNFDRRP
jgi:putative protease